jgi:hypothetical protein
MPINDYFKHSPTTGPEANCQLEHSVVVVEDYLKVTMSISWTNDRSIAACAGMTNGQYFVI